MAGIAEFEETDIDLGAIPIGSINYFEIKICNVGDDYLKVKNFTLVEDSGQVTWPYTDENTYITIPPPEGFYIVLSCITYESGTVVGVKVGQITATLTWEFYTTKPTNPANTQTVTVTVRANVVAGVTESPTTDAPDDIVIPYPDWWGVTPGPWDFTSQPDKWGYLNNPRWQVTARAFVKGGPDDYSGRESEEPQIWEHPNGEYSKDEQGVHHQCGHWHLVTKTEAPTTAVPEEFIHWYSCPTFILPSPTTPGQIWHITTLDDLPIDTFRIIEYVGQNYYWDTVYEYAHTDVESWEQWQEPDGSVYQRDGISVVALIGNDDDIAESHYYLETWVFDGDTLLNHTITPAGPTYPYGQILISNMDSRFCVIDNSGGIHVILTTYLGGSASSYDFISTDNGASFSPVYIGPAGTTFNSHYAGVFSDGTIYFGSRIKIHKSTNNGASWTDFADLSGLFISSLFYINDTFFGIGCSAQYSNHIVLKRSLNGTVYNTVLTVNDLWDKLSACNMLYDGTYYYLTLMFRNSIYIRSDGFTYVYRSSDGVSWTLISTIVDDAELGRPTRYVNWIALFWPTQIIKSGNTLFYFFYYSEEYTEAYGGPTNYLLCVWKSNDDGVTWEVVFTPYFDLTR